MLRNSGAGDQGSQPQRKFTLKGLTAGGAGIYTNPENDRARDYVIAALDEAGIDNTMTDYEFLISKWMGRP